MTEILWFYIIGVFLVAILCYIFEHIKVEDVKEMGISEIEFDFYKQVVYYLIVFSWIVIITLFYILWKDRKELWERIKIDYNRYKKEKE